MNPFVFIVGCPRSGTTLLRRLVNAHSQIAITPETQWIVKFYRKRIGLTPDGLVTPGLIPQILAHRKFSQLGLTVEQLTGLLRPSMTYAEFLTSLYDLYGLTQSKSLVGDKTSGYVTEIETLASLWPTAKFLHIIRDGRDVCLSMLAWEKAYRAAGKLESYAADPVSTTALWWQDNVRRGRQAAVTLPAGQYLEVRYEAIVTDAAAECRRICAFLSVGYDEAMPRFHERHEAFVEPDHAWGPVTPGLRDWRAQMSVEDIQKFESAAGAMLDELGYR